MARSFLLMPIGRLMPYLLPAIANLSPKYAGTVTSAEARAHDAGMGAMPIDPNIAAGRLAFWAYHWVALAGAEEAAFRRLAPSARTRRSSTRACDRAHRGPSSEL